MKGQRAGFFIPECERMLKRMMGENFAENSSRMESGLRITGLPERCNPEKVHPLAKVLWNMLTRGPILPAGPRLTRHILDSHSTGKKGEADASTVFNEEAYAHLNSLNQKYLFRHFKFYTAEKTEGEFGPEYNALFNRLFDMRTAAHLQRLILQALVLGHHKLFIEGAEEDLLKAVVDEINDWITWLNSLTVNKDQRLKTVSLSKKKDKATTIFYAYDDEMGMAICSVMTKEEPEAPAANSQSLAGDTLLTGERMEYAELEADKHLEPLNALHQHIFQTDPLKEDEIPLINHFLKKENEILHNPAGSSFQRAWQLAAFLQPGITLVADPDASSHEEPCLEWKEKGIGRAACLSTVNKGAVLAKIMEDLKQGLYQIVFTHPDLLCTPWFDASVPDPVPAGNSANSNGSESMPVSTVVMMDIQRVSDWGDGFSPEYLNAARKIYTWSTGQEGEIPIKGITQSVTYDVMNDLSRELSVSEDAVSEYDHEDPDAEAKAGDAETLEKADEKDKKKGVKGEDPFAGSVKKEKVVVDELLTGIRHEKRFHIRLLAKVLRQKYPDLVGGLKIGKDRYLYAHGKTSRNNKGKVIIGLLDLEDPNLKNHDKVRKNIEQHKASVIMTFIREWVEEHGNDGDYASLLHETRRPGIIKLLNEGGAKKQQVHIGLEYDASGSMVELARESGWKKADRKMFLSAAEGCKEGEEFVQNLQPEYEKTYRAEQVVKIRVNQVEDDEEKEAAAAASKEEKAKDSAEMPEELKEALAEEFYKSRTSADTLLALYRLKTAGIIDEYEADHLTGTVQVGFRKKKDEEYYKSLHDYIRQYFGKSHADQWLEKAKSRAEKDPIRGWVHTLIDFADEEITSRKRPKPEAEEYTGEVATGLDELGSDLSAEDTSLPEIIDKYLEYLNNPPDPGLSQVSAARQLRDACIKLRKEKGENHAGLEMLTAFSIFVVDVDTGKLNGNVKKREVAEEAMKLYRNSLTNLQAVEEWKEVSRTMKHVRERLQDLNPVSMPLLEPVETEILLHRTNERLKKFLKRTGISS